MSRELFGEERDRVIREHLEWWKGRDGRECIGTTDSPIAAWARRHSAQLAAERSDRNGYYRNTKGLSRGRIPLTPRSK